jgi:hypothetical protein
MITKKRHSHLIGKRLIAVLSRSDVIKIALKTY